MCSLRLSPRSLRLCVESHLPTFTSPVERVPRPPVRQLILVGDVLAEQKAVLGGLLQGGEIPIALELVRWLVVMPAVVLLVGLLAEAGRLAEELGGVADAERRNP